MNKENINKTITYIARPENSNCTWWSAILENISIDDLTSNKKLNYIKTNSDLELKEGAMLIDSEAIHHRKNRGYSVNFGFAIDDDVEWIIPTIERKMFIKSKGHQDLMKGSGDVAGVFRIALYIQRQDDKIKAFKELQNIKS